MAVLIKNDFSDYIVFVDESGYPGLNAIDPDYPVFVLAFCIFKKHDYIYNMSPRLQEIKFKYWGHDEVVLHEHDIRKPHGIYAILFDKAIKSKFLTDISNLIQEINFTLIAVVMNKQEMLKKYPQPENLYNLALEFGLERIFHFLQDHHQNNSTTHIIVEKRGKKEDAELELAFRRICDGNNAIRKTLPFSIEMIPKSSNSIGLQIADLVARPIGIKNLRPSQENKAYEILEAKFRKNRNGAIKGWGLKIFP